MNILFVCKHNRFRSKVAEAFFNFYCRKYKKKHKAKSCGTIKDIDVASSVLKIMKKQGVEIKDKKSRKISNKDVKLADLIIIVADNVELNVAGKRILKWKISDTSQENIKEIEERIKVIKKKVLSLVEKLNDN